MPIYFDNDPELGCMIPGVLYYAWHEVSRHVNCDPSLIFQSYFVTSSNDDILLQTALLFSTTTIVVFVGEKFLHNFLKSLQ